MADIVLGLLAAWLVVCIVIAIVLLAELIDDWKRGRP